MTAVEVALGPRRVRVELRDAVRNEAKERDGGDARAVSPVTRERVDCDGEGRQREGGKEMEVSAGGADVTNPPATERAREDESQACEQQGDGQDGLAQNFLPGETYVCNDQAGNEHEHDEPGDDRVAESETLEHTNVSGLYEVRDVADMR